jgi:hypothetical protein
MKSAYLDQLPTSKRSCPLRELVNRAASALAMRENLEIWRLKLSHEKADLERFGHQCQYTPRAARRIHV